MFVDPDLSVEKIFRKERAAESENERTDFEREDIDTSVDWY